MTKVKLQPIHIQDFEQLAKGVSADRKLTSKERKQLEDGFRALDRDGQLKGLELLKTESPELAKFAHNSGVVRQAESRRVGGDQGIDQFRAAVERAAPKGFNAWENSGLIHDFRALSKGDQATALAEVRASGNTKLTRALEDSVVEKQLSKKEEAAVGSKSIDDFDHAVATFRKGGARERNEVLDTFRNLTATDQERAIGGIKNELPGLAISLDRILNPRPLPVRPPIFGDLII